MDKSLSFIKENEFAVGHLSYDKSVNNLLRNDFNKVFLFREVRTALFSYFKFLKETNRQNADHHHWYHTSNVRESFFAFLKEQGLRRLKMYNALSNWVNAQDVVHLQYEWMVEKKIKMIHNSLIAIHPSFSELTEDKLEVILSEALCQPTITKSKKTSIINFSECWTDEAEDFFTKNEGDDINLRLGYI